MLFNITRVRFQWGAARTMPGKWYAGLVGVYRRPQAKGLGMAISLRGLLLWTLALGLAGYFGLCARYWLQLREQPHNLVTYRDTLLYPLSAEKRREVFELEGKALIATGMDDLRANQWHRGMMNLRLGLERHPADLDARLQLASLYVASNFRTKARNVLVRGLDAGWPGLDYVKGAVAVAKDGEDRELVIELCDQALAARSVPSHPDESERRWLVGERIRALLDEARAPDALAFAERESAVVDADLSAEVRLLSLLQTGRRDEAVAAAEAWRAQAPGSAQVCRLLARCYREAGRPDDMARVLAEIRTAALADVETAIFCFTQTFLAGRAAAGKALFADYVFRFGGVKDNFVRAAETLAELGRSDEIEMLLAAAADRGIREPRLLMARFKVLLAERRWAEAGRQLGAVRTEFSSYATMASGLLDFYQYLVSAVADPAEGPQTVLVAYVKERQLSMERYRACLDLLRVAGRLETARRIAVLGEIAYSGNAWLGEFRDGVEEMIAARKAAVQAEQVATAPAAIFQAPATFYAEVDRVAAQDGVAAALALFRDLRKSRAEWLATEEEPLLRRELELNANGDDLAALQGSVRFYLTADPFRRTQLIGLARAFHEQGHDEQARMLLTEILRKIPKDKLAASLLARWFPDTAQAAAQPDGKAK